MYQSRCRHLQVATQPDVCMLVHRRRRRCRQLQGPDHLVSPALHSLFTVTMLLSGRAWQHCMFAIQHVHFRQARHCCCFVRSGCQTAGRHVKAERVSAAMTTAPLYQKQATRDSLALGAPTNSRSALLPYGADFQLSAAIWASNHAGSLLCTPLLVMLQLPASLLHPISWLGSPWR